jgi:hypothetical protein
LCRAHTGDKTHPCGAQVQILRIPEVSRLILIWGFIVKKTNSKPRAVNWTGCISLGKSFLGIAVSL